MRCSIIFLYLCMVCGSVFAVDRYPFTSFQDAHRFEYLLGQFRCLVCQNQSLAESNAPLAQDLKMIIAARVRKGESDHDITQFLVARYGEFVRYQPTFSKTTSILWLAPFGLLLIGAGILIWVKRRSIHHDS